MYTGAEKTTATLTSQKAFPDSGANDSGGDARWTLHKEQCPQRQYMTALEQENSSGATMTGLEMRPATQLLTHGLRTVLGEKHTVQTVKKTSGVDSTSSRMTSHSVTPAVLDGQVQERVDERDAAPSVQQDVVAANAADDAGRRTWTQARQWMNENTSKSWIL